MATQRECPHCKGLIVRYGDEWNCSECGRSAPPMRA